MKKGIVQVLFANVIFLIIGIASNFLLPKFLTVEAYALLKTYALYISYAGILSFGFHDGLYLMYGGKEFNDINSKELTISYKNYVYYLLSLSLIIDIVGVLLSRPMLIIFGVAMIANNILSFFRSLYQAVGEFKLYGRALNTEKILIFIVDLVLIFAIKAENGYVYVVIQTIISFIIVLYLRLLSVKRMPLLKYGSISTYVFKRNCSMGIALMLGNLSSSVFTGIDRWFVKIFINTSSFAMYSFAVSMEQIVNVFITPITISMYNYFCNKRPKEQIKKIKKLVLIWGFSIITLAFPAKYILENVLQKYIQSNSVVFILFAANVFYAVIKGIYVNIYKAERKQNKYLHQMILMIMVAIGLNSILYHIFRNMEAIATGTLVTSIIWLVVCEIDNASLRYGYKEYLSIGIMLSTYLYCGYRHVAITGMFIYIIICVLVCVVFMKDSCRDIVEIINDFLCKFLRKR